MLITCLGISGSGKTVFLGTLLDSLFSQTNAQGGFYLLDHGTAKKGQDIFSDNLEMSDISIQKNLEQVGKDGFRGYPDGTKSTRLRKFSLMQGKESIIDIGWLDYKGGLLSGGSVEPEEADYLYSSLDLSTAIVVYLDGYRIATSESIKQARQRVGLNTISNILSHLESSKEGKITNILIVLTQCDAIEDATWIGPARDYAPLKLVAKEVLGGLIEMINRNPLWHCGMVAVTAIGVGNNRRTIKQEATFQTAAVIEDEIIDFPEPHNIVEAFFWLVGCEVAAQRLIEKEKINSTKGKMDDELSQLEKNKNAAYNKIQEKEKERLKNLSFFARLIEENFYADETENMVRNKIDMENFALTMSHRVIARELQEQIFEANTKLSKFETALQPLFNASNNAVTRI